MLGINHYEPIAAREQRLLMSTINPVRVIAVTGGKGGIGKN